MDNTPFHANLSRILVTVFSHPCGLKLDLCDRLWLFSTATCALEHTSSSDKHVVYTSDKTDQQTEKMTADGETRTCLFFCCSAPLSQSLTSLLSFLSASFYSGCILPVRFLRQVQACLLDQILLVLFLHMGLSGLTVFWYSGNDLNSTNTLVVELVLSSITYRCRPPWRSFCNAIGQYVVSPAMTILLQHDWPVATKCRPPWRSSCNTIGQYLL